MKLDRSERISGEVAESYVQWAEELSLLKTIKIPQCYFSLRQSIEGVNVQIHGFFDTSQIAYAAVIYMITEFTCR